MSEIKQKTRSTSMKSFLKYRPLIWQLVSRDLKVKYRRSFLGYLWSLLNPLLMMLLQTIIFSFIFRNDIPNFPLYLICGNTLFTFFNESTNVGMNSVLQNAALIKKVYIPKFIFPISSVVSGFVTLLFSMGATIVVMLVTRAQFHVTLLLFWAPLVLLFIFSCGMAILLSALTVYFRDMKHLYGVLTMAWMYATPLFYPLSILPAAMQSLMKLNPMFHFIDIFRQLVMYGTIPSAMSWLAAGISAVFMMTAGILVFRRLQKNFILYI